MTEPHAMMAGPAKQAMLSVEHLRASYGESQIVHDVSQRNAPVCRP
jgi:hypothetical protein